MLKWFKARARPEMTREEELTYEGYKAVHMVNRSALILRPKMPFIRWAAKVTGDTPQNAQKILAQDRTPT